MMGNDFVSTICGVHAPNCGYQVTFQLLWVVQLRIIPEEERGLEREFKIIAIS